MDIFCVPWISSEEFGQLVDRIGNWKFAEHAQFYVLPVRFMSTGQCLALCGGIVPREISYGGILKSFDSLECPLSNDI